jgi:hypothetical protein
MTGMEWAVCDDPRLMVDALRRQCDVSDRKWRLFVAAFWRSHADNLTASREDVIAISEIMEDWAENGRLAKGLKRSRTQNIIFFAADAFMTAMRTTQEPMHWLHGGLGATEKQTSLLRDLFGNPFRTPELEPRWRTSDVVGLARAIYEEKAFDRMPILADALMDAGCEDEGIVGHCRGDGQHVRGCWVLDLVLGKT